MDKDDSNVPAELLAEYDSILKELEAVSRPLRTRLNDVDKMIRLARLQALTEEPKCPDCGASSLRQKCMWEMSDCSRREACSQYGGAYMVEKHLKGLKGQEKV